MANNRNELNKNLAQMLKGGVIMDVTTPEQAKIAQDAGACAVMALERIPADIRAAGGVSRMSDPAMIKGIQEAVSIPVMAKVSYRPHRRSPASCRPSKSITSTNPKYSAPADDVYHIDKNRIRRAVRVRREEPGRSAAPCRRGRVHDPHQGRAGHRRRHPGRASHAHHEQADPRTRLPARRRGVRGRQAAGRAGTISPSTCTTMAVCRSSTSQPVAWPLRPMPRS